MSDCENNGCFCLDELTECSENLKRLITALNEQYPVYLEKRDYGSISELHITAKALWAEFANILHPLGEYGDEQLYSTALKMFEAIQKFGYLNGGNYPALVSALNSFADMLPNKKSIDAKAAAHLMNRIKMGYFPTDLEHIRLIKQAVNFPKSNVNILDPCCGEGLALKAFAENENADTYGIELDESRGHAAQKKLDRVGLGSFFGSSVPPGRFHALLLNPPYLSCPGNGGSKRMERAFLADTLPLLMKGGLLIYIIPYHRANESVCRICDSLAARYDLHGMPGFYRTDGIWHIAAFKSGILIPIRDKQNLIQGLQIRFDNPPVKRVTTPEGITIEKTGTRFMWFSSSKQKKFEGTSVPSYIHITGNRDSDTVYLTEGGLKSDVASFLSGDKLFIGLTGVQNTGFLNEVISLLGPKKIVECVDMDVRSNPQVQKAQVKIQAICAPLCETYKRLFWPIDQKGIDDLLLFRKLKKEYEEKIQNEGKNQNENL